MLNSFPPFFTTTLTPNTTINALSVKHIARLHAVIKFLYRRYTYSYVHTVQQVWFTLQLANIDTFGFVCYNVLPFWQPISLINWHPYVLPIMLPQLKISDPKEELLSNRAKQLQQFLHYLCK